MASYPHKRVSGADWETPSSKAPKASCPTLAEISTPRGARRPLTGIQQPRQYPTHVSPPTAPQRKPSGNQISSTYQPPYGSRPGPRYNKPVLSHAASQYQPPSTHYGYPPSNPHPPNQAGPSHPHVEQSRSAAVKFVPGVPYQPEVRHSPHPGSKLCQSSHWVPYPLGLMPFASWSKLHHKPEHAESHCYLCPVCQAPRKLTPHVRKLFLVAERLSREGGTTSMHDKSLDEELNWAVNYELGILDLFVEDPCLTPGGKHSQMNRFHPYANEYEMKLAFKYIFMTEEITETTWSLWIGTQLDLQKLLGGEEKKNSPKKPSLQEDGLKMLESKSIPVQPTTRDVETIDLTDSPSPPPKSKAPMDMPKPPYFFTPEQQKAYDETGAFLAAQPLKKRNHSMTAAPPLPPPFFNPQRRIVSYKTLQDFYGLLDKIERTSYVGAIFLEAYAERLRDDLCKACWLKRNVNLDLY